MEIVDSGGILPERLQHFRPRTKEIMTAVSGRLALIQSSNLMTINAIGQLRRRVGRGERDLLDLYKIHPEQVRCSVQDISVHGIATLSACAPLSQNAFDALEGSDLYQSLLPDSIHDGPLGITRRLNKAVVDFIKTKCGKNQRLANQYLDLLNRMCV